KKEKKDTIKKIVTETAAKLDISHLLNRDILNLSGGESQRVAIARASAVDPLVYLLDEPTAALDINTRKGILELFKNIHKENKNTFIHVTHNFEEALFLADRIAVIKDGEMIQIGEPNEIFNHPKSKFVADFVGFENVFHGKIKDNIFTSVHDEFFKLYLPSENTDNIYLAVKSEDIIVSKEKFESSARNQFKGIVDEVIHKLANIEIKFKVNNSKLICAVTKFSFEEMQIEPGKQFWLTFKSSSIKAFPH
ncbi:MAG: TOBE domain-containing protein, partial [Candidatus Delongbacteria bacterium]|nr:TOBE domain-containing protein [Candidatus Delongbacteria bacterium]